MGETPPPPPDPQALNPNAATSMHMPDPSSRLAISLSA
jgi:hypothetical protein